MPLLFSGTIVPEGMRRLDALFYACLRGKLTTVKWAKLTKCSHDTALRDIQDLVARGILVRNPGGGRSTSYGLPNTWSGGAQ
jgi:Fic family protein